VIVVKVGGAVVDGALPPLDDELVVVHGAGPQITAELKRRGLPVEFSGGRRVTSAAAIWVVREVLARVNAELCSALGPRAVGLMGDEIGVAARQVPGLGLVGSPLPCRPAAIDAALEAGAVPVVAPLAVGPLNVNADELAAALAAGLAAERLLFLTDVPGLLLGGEVVPEIQADAAADLLASGELEGGILPKLDAAVMAARLGVNASIGRTAVLA
jgi:acetylglutamate kinase